jgi:hypothetical protein
MNLRAYAASQECIYGSAQGDVVETRRLAKRFPQRVAERRTRPPVLWFTEEDPTKGRPVTFTGHSSQGVETARFVVAPGAKRGRPLKAADLWGEQVENEGD